MPSLTIIHQEDGQQWVFELVSSTSAQKGFQSMFFTLTLEEAKQYSYDIIIVGTGIGGGIIAADLFQSNSMLGENAKSILVIEKGGLVFHSHCLNAARPSGLNQDRGQQNDTFFAKFRMNYTLSDTMTQEQKKDWKGGPMYCLGGRSAAWGLFCPRIHDRNLRKYFSKSVADDLLTTYYREAEKLMDLSLPVTTTEHQDLMERLNVANDPIVQWQWGRIASEFRPDGNFDFANGAYSSIDKLVEIAMSKPIVEGQEREHKNFKMLLDTEVRSVVWGGPRNNRVAGLRVRTIDGKEDTISIKAGGQIVLAAGTVNTAAILLRSQVDLAGNGGLHVTDHDIFYKALPFTYKNPADRKAVGPIKVQTYVENVNSRDPDEIVLANMSIDASSFLPRGYAQYDDFPKWIMALIRGCDLNPRNMVQLVNDEPVVTILRDRPFDMRDPDLQKLQQMTNAAMETMKDVLKIDFIPDPADSGTYFHTLELGGVAHELGTVPMKRADKPSAPYCLDDTLQLRNYEGLYVCDLSIFPWSPEVNPTATLAAFALRLSRTVLHPRNFLYNQDGSITVPDPDSVYVVNHTGQTIKVWIANKAGTTGPNRDTILEPGQFVAARRNRSIPESVSVYKLAFNSQSEFVSEPELYIANPGIVTPILS